MRYLFCLALCLSTHCAIAWEGYDYENGTFVEIEKGNLVRRGREIEVFDYQRGYINVEVESVYRRGRTVEVEVFDPNSGETRTLEMND
jgi:hypothetical protein